MQVRNIIYAIFAILITAIQTTILDYIGILGVKPNLLLTLVVAVALLSGPLDGGIIGLWCGVLFDIVGYGGFGFHAIFYLYTGVVIGVLSRRYFRDNILLNMLICLASSIALELLYFIFSFLIWGKGGFTGLIILKILILGIYTALFSIPIYLLVKKVCKKARSV